MNYEYTLAHARYMSGKHNHSALENEVKLKAARPQTPAERMGWHATPYVEQLLKKKRLWD